MLNFINGLLIAQNRISLKEYIYIAAEGFMNPGNVTGFNGAFINRLNYGNAKKIAFIEPQNYD